LDEVELKMKGKGDEEAVYDDEEDEETLVGDREGIEGLMIQRQGMLLLGSGCEEE
jgi:hypothetical protein